MWWLFYVVINIYGERMLLLFLYCLVFLLSPVVYFYVSHCCVIGCRHISYSSLLVNLALSLWGVLICLFMFLGLNSTLSDMKITTTVFFFLIWNCLVYLCPLFYFKHIRTFLFSTQFLYTAYRMTSFANCDGLYVVHLTSSLPNSSAARFPESHSLHDSG